MANIFGTDGSDLRNGGSSADFIVGWADGFESADTGSDTLNGGGGADTIFGGGGGDVVLGSGGGDMLFDGVSDPSASDVADDRLNGGGGSDTVVSTGGDDTLNGSTGIDTWQAYYLSNTTGVALSYDVGTGTFNVSDGTSASSFEVAAFLGGTGNDTLSLAGFTGLGFLLDGFAGDDTLIGGSGDDVIGSTGGHDSIDGGDGYDVWAYVSPSAVELSYDVANDTFSATDGTTATGVEEVSVGGSAGNDTLSLAGFAGNASLTDGSGSDVLTGGSGNDTISSTDGDDTIDGGAGTDQWAFFASDSTPLNFTYDAGSDSLLLAGGAPVINVEYVSFTAGGGDDVLSLVGYDGRAYLDDGIGGSDSLVGGDGDDTLRTTGGGDTVDGGAGVDFWIGDYQYVADPDAPVSLTYDAGSNTITASDGTTVTNVEAVEVVGVHGDDNLSLAGFAGYVVLYGGDGNDTLTGGAGENVLQSNFGDDTLNTQAGGSSYVDGGQDFDIWHGDYTAATAKLTLAYNAGTAAFTLTGGSSATNVEAVWFAYGTGNDKLSAVGFLGNGTIDGGGGNDTLTGGAGVDDLHGGGGRDKINGGPDNVGNTLDGGYGSDTVTGSIGNDHIFANQADEADTAGDRLNGGDGDDEIHGAGGRDTITGGTGVDTIYGNGGNDSLVGGDDSCFIEGGTGADTLLGSDRDDSLVGGDHNDRLFGRDGEDILEGGDDADQLTGGDSDDWMWGGTGADLFRFVAVSDIGDAAVHDIVQDFDTAEDRLDFSAIDAIDGGGGSNDTFVFLGSADFSSHAGGGELRTFQNGGSTFVEGDTNGDDIADFQLELLGLHNLTASGLGRDILL